MKTKVYVVTMQRWGGSETHNYVQGVFTDKAQADKCGEAEKAWRGGKYEPRITEMILDEHDQDSLDWLEACNRKN